LNFKKLVNKTDRTYRWTFKLFKDFFFGYVMQEFCACCHWHSTAIVLIVAAKIKEPKWNENYSKRPDICSYSHAC